MELDLAYNLLKLSDGASLKEVTRAFHREAQASHPDRFADAPETERKNAEERFKLINEAYHTILDEGDLSAAPKPRPAPFTRNREFSEEEKQQSDASAFGAFAMGESKRLYDRLENRDRGLLIFVSIFGVIGLILIGDFRMMIGVAVVIVVFTYLGVLLNRYFGE